jgi:hypothetical protein
LNRLELLQFLPPPPPAKFSEQISPANMKKKIHIVAGEKYPTGFI